MRSDDHRVLAAELGLTGVRVSGGPAPGPSSGAVGAGELDEVDLVDQRGAGLAHATDDVEDVGAADLALPGLDDLGQAERGDLGGLDDDRGAG